MADETSTQPGGTGDGGTTQQGQPGGTGGTQQTSTTQQGQQATTSTQSGGTGTGEDPAAQVAMLRSQLEVARGDAAKARTEAKQTAATEAEAALLAKMAKALGLAKDEAPNPEKLAADLERTTSEHRSALVELQVLKVAGGEKADPVALLDSRAFLASIADLDPKSAGFGDSVKAAIAKAVKDNPRLGAGQPVGSGGGEVSGGTRDKGGDGESWADIEKAVKAGRSRR
jgi:hypothetical protein